MILICTAINTAFRNSNSILRRKNKIRLTAAKKLNLRFTDRLRPDTVKRYQVFFAAFL